jgi:hypothetical protein
VSSAATMSRALRVWMDRGMDGSTPAVAPAGGRVRATGRRWPVVPR